jgi:heat shock protein HslJ
MTITWAGRIRTAAAAALLLAAAVACSDESSGGDVLGRGRTFLSTGVTEDDTPIELVPGTRVTLTLEDGTLRAYAGCNHLSGEVTIEGDRLILGDELTTTAIGCDQPAQAQDDWLVAVLRSEPTWRPDGDVLTITSGTTTIELVDEDVAMPDRALVGTTWTLETVFDRETASSIPTGAIATIMFGANGRIEGANSCNGFGGDYTASDTTITFGPVTQSLAGCDSERAAIEAHVMAVVAGGDVAYAIDGDVLSLTDADGRGLAYRAEPA